jgi:hypothetical protein
MISVTIASTKVGSLWIEARALDAPGNPLWLVVSDSNGPCGEITLLTGHSVVAARLADAIDEIMHLLADELPAPPPQDVFTEEEELMT